jgi:hypothetical protein
MEVQRGIAMEAPIKAPIKTVDIIDERNIQMLCDIQHGHASSDEQKDAALTPDDIMYASIVDRMIGNEAIKYTAKPIYNLDDVKGNPHHVNYNDYMSYMNRQDRIIDIDFVPINYKLVATTYKLNGTTLGYRFGTGSSVVSLMDEHTFVYYLDKINEKYYANRIIARNVLRDIYGSRLKCASAANEEGANSDVANEITIERYYMNNHPKRIIIGLMGDIGCGKSMIAGFLASRHGMLEYSIATPLKQIAICMGFTRNQVFGTQEQKTEINAFWGISGREFLQKFGSEVCRDALPRILPNMALNDSGIWARLMEKKIGETECDMVVSDVRFKDEALTIWKAGGYLIRIERPDNRHQQPQPSKHISEMEKYSIVPNVILVNDKDPNNAFNKIKHILKLIQIGIIRSNTERLII